LNQKNVSVASIKQALANSEMQIQAYETELVTKMTSALDALEQGSDDYEIQASIGGMETRFGKIYAERVDMQERVNITKVELSENLMRRRDDISARIEAAQAASDTPGSAGRA
jgi:chaperonin cofactor prefoldin